MSNSLRQAPWGPADIIGDDVARAFRSLKSSEGPDLTILGSAELVSYLCAEGLIDSLEIMIYPVAIGTGSPLFSKLATVLDFTLTSHRIFASGTVLLTYASRNVSS